ncbi:MAG: hypothetical protein K2W33_19255 [Burkholderiales bacterium]|nr:hypothetical protein [Burkholderiales bacterium]
MELYIGTYVSCCVCVALLARFRGRSAIKWMISSLLLTPLLSAVLILIQANKSIRHARPTSKGKVVNPIPKPLFTWPERDEYNFELVGTEFYQGELQHIANHHGNQQAATPLTAMLIPVDDNRLDDTAVRVDVDGLTVGYLSRIDSKGYHRRMAELKQKVMPTACAAMLVARAARQSGQPAQFTIKLGMKPFN